MGLVLLVSTAYEGPSPAASASLRSSYTAVSFPYPGWSSEGSGLLAVLTTLLSFPLAFVTDKAGLGEALRDVLHFRLLLTHLHHAAVFQFLLGGGDELFPTTL